MFSVEDAVSLAVQKHKGQVDKAGQPYILHVLRVMESAVRYAYSYQSEGFIKLSAQRFNNIRITAVLHDILEDTDTSSEELRVANVPVGIIADARDNADMNRYLIAGRPINKKIETRSDRYNSLTYFLELELMRADRLDS